METPVRPFVLTAPPPLLRSNLPVRRLEFNIPTAPKMYFGETVPTYRTPDVEAERPKHPTMPEVNGLSNLENTMLPKWGSHHGVQMVLSGHPVDEMDMGIPNPLWCVYRTPVEDSENEESPEDLENEEALNESKDVENPVSNMQVIR